MFRSFLFFLLATLAGSCLGAEGDSDNDGLCVDDQPRVGVCIAGPDTDDTNPDVNDDGICDGINGVVATNEVRGCMRNYLAGADTDADGIFDELEIGDADNDGIPDYLDRDTTGSGFGDSDSDGIDDQAECGQQLPCNDTDKDGTYDYLDTNSDGDGLTDDEEADHIAANGAERTVEPLNIDGDSLPDYRDDDSDNDGRPDAIEGGLASDQDGDGIPDIYDFDDRSAVQGGGDSDNDGRSDKTECPLFPTNCPDSDIPPDGKPDYLDSYLDTDDDGIPDNVEDLNFDADNDPATRPTDTDGDGEPDYRDRDSDGDSVLDSDERNTPFNQEARLDDDRDGIPDVVDPVDAQANADGGDSDLDGVADSLECPSWPRCPDTDADGIFDYLDSDSFPPEPELGEISSGVDGVGAFWWLMLLLPFIATLTRAEENVGESIQRGWQAPDLYFGVALGRSQLEPETGNSLYKLDERGDWAYKINAGWDINHYWSIDGYYADLGEARLKANADVARRVSKPEGQLGYRMMGVSVLGNFWLWGGERLPGSLALYGRAGLNHMSNQATDLNYNQQSSWQLALGTGLELYFKNNFSLRFELESYDSDAALLSLGLVKRFGLQQQLVYALPEGPVAMISDAEPTSAGIRQAIIRPLVLDADNDGFLDDVDECLNTPAYSPLFSVDGRGCAPFQGVIDDLEFQSGSDQLTAQGKKKLHEVIPALIAQLAESKAMRVQVRAHTDSQGSMSYNRQLSQRRAESIVKELLARGVNREQLDARGMGESQPRASNDSAEGRALNRRVEFNLIID